MMRVLVGVVVAAAALLSATDARAGTARVERSVTPGYKGSSSVSETIVFTADAGQRNELTIAGTVRTLTIEDAAAPISAGPGCTSDGPRRVRCEAADPLDEWVGARLDTGDRDDVLRDVTASRDRPYSTLIGGPGDDRLFAARTGTTLVGGPGADRLVGGPAGDLLVGGADGDVLTGGDGTDDLQGDGAGAPPAADRIDGGPDADTVSYAERTTGVDVDLRRSEGNGTAGEGDLLTGVEGVMGGRGSDRLAGDDGPNRLDGAPLDGRDDSRPRDVLDGFEGDDTLKAAGGGPVLRGGAGDDVLDATDEARAGRLRGGAGDDRIEAGFEHDRIDGGSGDDDLYLGQELGNTPSAFVTCGPGRDVVELPSPGQVLDAACERMILQNGWLELSVRRSGARGFTVTFRTKAGRPCRQVLTLRGRSTWFGRAAVRPRIGHPIRVAIRAKPRARRLLRSGRPLALWVRVASKPRCDARFTGGSRGVHGFVMRFGRRR